LQGYASNQAALCLRQCGLQVAVLKLVDVYQFAVLCKPSCYMVAHCLLPSCSYYVVIMHRRNGQKCNIRATKCGQLSAILATLVSHYRSWNLTVTCPGCRERKEVRIERHISDGRGEEAVSKFLTRLRCGTCRRMPDIIQLHREAPWIEIVLIGPGGLLMAINVTRDMVTRRTPG
jgi:hypothetical protein